MGGDERCDKQDSDQSGTARVQLDGGLVLATQQLLRSVRLRHVDRRRI